LPKKFELIIGEVLAGNTSIDMRNMGVAILDTLLKTSAINKAQHAKLYKQYFSPIYSVRNKDNNKPGNFVTKFTRRIVLDNNHEYAIGLNLIINMSFTWFNMNAGYGNHLIRLRK